MTSFLNMHIYSRQFLGLLTALLFITACSSPPPVPPAVELLPAEFSISGVAPMQPRWWQAFQDETLDLLIAEALSSNLTLKAAWSRVEEARALARREASGLFPDISIVGSAESVERGSTEFNAGEREDEIELGAMASYELDLWGRVRAQARAERFEFKAEVADYKAAEISLTAEIARVWFQLLQSHETVLVLEDQIQTNERALQVLQTQFGNGQVRSADILRQRQLLEATRTELLSEQSILRTLNHQLSVLLGIPPQNGASFLPSELPRALPPLPETGIPADLVLRRPDCQRALLQLQASDAAVAAAIRDRFPKITLSVGISTEDAEGTELFDEWLDRFVADLLFPIIDGGRRRAEVERVKAVQRQRVYLFGEVVLTALREVEDALVREQKQLARIVSIEKQIVLAERTQLLVERDYFNGVGNYLDVLQARTAQQELIRDVLSEREGLLEIRIALYRALAGGVDGSESEGTL